MKKDLPFHFINIPKLKTPLLLPPTYEFLEFLGPAPKLSKPLNHLPPRANLSSVSISLLFNEKILELVRIDRKSMKTEIELSYGL